MKAAIIDGNMDSAPVTGAVIHCLEPLLASSGYQVSVTSLREKNVEPCKACQQCSMTGQWSCTQGDDWPSIAQTAIAADLLVLLSPISFGCHSSLLKSFLDRLLFNLSPNFMRNQTGPAPGKSSHCLKKLGAIGLLSGIDPEQEATFCELSRRNGLSFGCSRSSATVVCAQPSPRALITQMNQLLEGVIG